MKKAKPTVEQPIGIVITTGHSAQISPRARAYFWCEVPAASEDSDK